MVELAESPLRERVRLEEGGCWIWEGAINNCGYGMAWSPFQKKTAPAHRVSYQMHVGPISDGLQIHHECGVRACINPRHLRQVTARQNIRLAKGTMSDYCPHGHLRTEENTYWQRRCYECAQTYNRKKRGS